MKCYKCYYGICKVVIYWVTLYARWLARGNTTCAVIQISKHHILRWYDCPFRLSLLYQMGRLIFAVFYCPVLVDSSLAIWSLCFFLDISRGPLNSMTVAAIILIGWLQKQQVWMNKTWRENEFVQRAHISCYWYFRDDLVLFFARKIICWQL